MTDGSSAIPVIAGLAVGITFVVLFSAMIKPAFMLSDEELVSKYSELAEVKYFLEKYPDAKAEVNRNSADHLQISFSEERQVEPPSELSTGVNTLGIHVYAKPNRVSFDLYCGVHGGITVSWGFADNGGIDEASKVCFDENYPPTSPDLPRFPIGIESENAQ